jgi:hypothetical protein
VVQPEEERSRREKHRAVVAASQDVDRTRRFVQREGLWSVMNDTKWEELVSAMRSLADFTPRYRQKHVRSPEPASWDREWFYHLRPFSVVEWVDIDPGPHVAKIEKTLREIHVPFSREGPYLRVWGYVRPGTSPLWA